VSEDLTGSIQPIEVGHADIQQKNIRVQLGSSLHRFASIFGFVANFPAWVLLEQRSNTFPCHFVVIRDKDSKRAQIPPPPDCRSFCQGKICVRIVALRGGAVATSWLPRRGF